MPHRVPRSALRYERLRKTLRPAGSHIGRPAGSRIRLVVVLGEGALALVQRVTGKELYLSVQAPMQEMVRWKKEEAPTYSHISQCSVVYAHHPYSWLLRTLDTTAFNGQARHLRGARAWWGQSLVGAHRRGSDASAMWMYRWMASGCVGSMASASSISASAFAADGRMLPSCRLRASSPERSRSLVSWLSVGAPCDDEV